MLMRELLCAQFPRGHSPRIVATKLTTFEDDARRMVRVSDTSLSAIGSGHTKTPLTVCPKAKWLVPLGVGEGTEGIDGVVVEVKNIGAVLALTHPHVIAIILIEAPGPMALITATRTLYLP